MRKNLTSRVPLHPLSSRIAAYASLFCNPRNPWVFFPAPLDWWMRDSITSFVHGRLVQETILLRGERLFAISRDGGSFRNPRQVILQFAPLRVSRQNFASKNVVISDWLPTMNVSGALVLFVTAPSIERMVAAQCHRQVENHESGGP